MSSHDTVQTGPTDRFIEEVERYGVTVAQTSVANATETLTDRVERPAVGVELSHDGVSVPDHVTRDPTPSELEAATTGITEATLGIAAYGSLALHQDQQGSEPISLFVDKHVAVIHEDDIVGDISTAFRELGDPMQETQESFILATGPSATADMGALVQGAHGPKEVEVILLT